MLADFSRWSPLLLHNAPARPASSSLLSSLLPLHVFTEAPKDESALSVGRGRQGLSLLLPQTSVHAIIRFKTEIPHKSFMGSTVQVLLYPAAFSSPKALFHRDPACPRNAIALQTHTSLSCQRLPYCASSSYICTFSTYQLSLQMLSLVGFALKTDWTRMVLMFILHKGNKVVKPHSKFLEGKRDSEYI